jgi:predicted nucleic acid-binding protein
VVAKWFNRGEANDKEATLVRDAWVDGRAELFAPSLLLFEVANSIWRNHNVETGIARSLTRLAVRISPKLLNPTEEVTEQAMQLAKAEKLAFYDAIYPALSKSLSLSLITADREQLTAARGYAKVVHLSAIEKQAF